MAEDSKETETTQETTEETTAESQKPETPIELTPEQWEIAYKSPRFKELNEAKKERDRLMKETKAKEEEEMKRKGELEKLLEQKESEMEELNNKFSTQTRNNAILAEAAKKGAVDPEAVVRLIDANKIEMDENGTPTNVSETVDALLSEKTYLVGQAPNMGSDTTTSNNSDKPTYKDSELRAKIANDVNFLNENESEIQAAYAEGRVDLNA